MPTGVGIVDVLSTPPLASLQQVLDDGGPYGPGDYTLRSFTTSGAFLLPAGTYDIGGTYGIYVEVTSVPPTVGIDFGWNDADFPVASGDRYRDRMVQVCLLRNFPITGADLLTDVFDVHYVAQLFLWPLSLGAATKVGLHVNPGYSCDLFYMCVL